MSNYTFKTESVKRNIAPVNSSKKYYRGDENEFRMQGYFKIKSSTKTK
jgi:hypothetical protein